MNVKGDPDDQAIEGLRADLARLSPSDQRRFVEKFLLAALGSIPWVGGFISAMASFKMDESSIQQDNLQIQWLKEHQRKINSLRETLENIVGRFDSLGEGINERLQSEEYLDLVRKAFRAWDEADTEEKRRYTANLVANSAGTRLCSDDVIRLFIDWLRLYHEAHLAVIRHVFQHPGATRYGIWTTVYGPVPREDSAEADLFRLLIRDLSMGGVVRIERETDESGAFLRKRPPPRRGSVSPTTESSFEATKPYVLTELVRKLMPKVAYRCA